MSEVRLVIRDATREIEACQHGSFAERVLAALSAEPETIQELDGALERFIVRSDHSFFRGFSPGSDDTPYDAGLVIIDLAARLVICDSSYCAAAPEGSVTYHNGEHATEIHLNYHLSDDWLLVEDATDWRALAEERRRERRLPPPLDARAVLYGEPLLQFIAEQCFEGFRDRGPAAKEDYHDPLYQRESDLIRDIHVRWMMTRRDDLRAQTPRQMMLSRRPFTGDSLQDREFQWSLTNQCPPGLPPDSAGYRFAGFGTHEMVVYYDLVRELLWHCRRDVAERGDVAPEQFVEKEITRLGQLREEWLDSGYSDCGDRTARSIIHNERSRIPEGQSGLEAMIDDDCPLCQMQAEMDGPVFWHLDGSHLDNDFAFSLWHETYEEWEQEQRKWEEFNRRFEATEAEKKCLGVKYPGDGYANPDVVWKESFSAPHSPDQPLLMRLFAIGAHLGELIVDLKEPGQRPSSEQYIQSPVDGDLADRLRRVFGNLRDGVRSTGVGQGEPVIRFILGEFCDTLDAVRGARPDLGLKCVDLRDRVQRFLEPPNESSEAPDPFDDDYLPS